MNTGIVYTGHVEVIHGNRSASEARDEIGAVQDGMQTPRLRADKIRRCGFVPILQQADWV
jgi:hypothetical protein